jgi:ERCC4-type nuclease
MAKIVIDERERASGVPDRLRSMSARIEFKMLDVGDYIISEYAIERKDVRDFLRSLFSGRLFDQAYRLSESYKLPIMIVEGDAQKALNDLSNPRVFWGALASLSLTYGVRIFFTANASQTADFIYTLAKHGPFDKRVKPLVVRKPRMESVADFQLAVVGSLPGIGPKSADKLLRRFKTVRRIFSASATELALTGEIGRAKAHKIVRFLNSEYKPGEKAAAQMKLS